MYAPIESLEQRRLLSVDWTTVDTFQLVPGQPTIYEALTANAAGDLYAVGRAIDVAGDIRLVVREKPAGDGSTWTTTADVSPNPMGSYGTIVDAEVTADGDLYVAANSDGVGRWCVARRPAGESAFTVLDQFNGMVSDLTIDAAGNVFAVGRVIVTTTVRNKQTSTSFWTVRKQTAGASAFVTVDSFRYAGAESSAASGITSIAEGGAAGLYVVGSGGNHSTAPVYRHLVRKSTDGGQTWSLVDDFAYQDGQWSVAKVVAGDGEGNVYVAGKANSKGSKRAPTDTHWTIRKSSSGATGSWSLDNVVAMGPFWGNEPVAIGADSDGNIYVAGKQIGSDTITRAVVRSNSGGSWHTEDVAFEAGTELVGVATDPAGGVFVGGFAYDTDGHEYGFVRSRGTLASATFSSQRISADGDDGDDDLLAAPTDALTAGA